MVTIDLLDALMARYSLRSDYAIAKFLDITPQTIYRYRKGHGQLDDETAVKVANLLDRDPGEVLALIYAERTKCPQVRATWNRVAKVVAGTAAAFVVSALAVSVVGFDAGALAAFAPVAGISYTQDALPLAALAVAVFVSVRHLRVPPLITA